jgi:hypothetical protein
VAQLEQNTESYKYYESYLCYTDCYVVTVCGKAVKETDVNKRTEHELRIMRSNYEVQLLAKTAENHDLTAKLVHVERKLQDIIREKKKLEEQAAAEQAASCRVPTIASITYPQLVKHNMLIKKAKAEVASTFKCEWYQFLEIS